MTCTALWCWMLTVDLFLDDSIFIWLVFVYVTVFSLVDFYTQEHKFSQYFKSMGRLSKFLDYKNIMLLSWSYYIWEKCKIWSLTATSIYMSHAGLYSLVGTFALWFTTGDQHYAKTICGFIFSSAVPWQSKGTACCFLFGSRVILKDWCSLFGCLGGYCLPFMEAS